MMNQAYEQYPDNQNFGVQPNPLAQPISQRANDGHYAPNNNVQHQQQAAHQNNAPAQYSSFHTYGKKHALCFNFGFKNGVRVVNVDAAEKLPGADKKFNWNQKITVLITQSELPHFVLTLLGHRASFEADFHGGGRKGFTIKSQDGGMFMTVFDQGRTCAVPITPEDSFYIVARACSHLLQDYPGLTATDLIQMMKLTVMRLSQ